MSPANFSTQHREASATRESYKRLLESLYFPDMHARQEGIEEAHKQTFEWIFEKSGDNVHPWHNFIGWLENGRDTYWIAGKAGSGKSTLMNFICHDPRTVAALRTWSGSDEIFISQFFFWNPGTELQKSLTGLLRSLVYQIMDRYPNVMSVLAESTILAQHRLQQLPTWTVQRLGAVVQSLLSHGLGTDRLCIFIDGLDEFEGDQAVLLDLIEGLKQFSWIKFCVSSRPCPLFRERLGSSAMLKLQDLTKSDMRKYVTDELNHALLKASQAQLSSLRLDHTIERILRKAEGVFLWVKLAVRDQIEGIWDKDDVDQLERRLEALPDKVEDLYEHMLQKINRVHREEAAQYLQLILHKGDLSLFIVALGSHKRIDDILQFSSDITISDIRHHCDLIGERVATTCRGLLEVYEIRDNSERKEETLSRFIANLDSENLPSEQREDLVQLRFHESCSQVRFLHRSAFEFFTSNEQGKTFLEANGTTSLHPQVLHVKAVTARTIFLSVIPSVPIFEITSIMEEALFVEKETGVAQPALMNLVDRSITILWERSQDHLPDVHWCREWGYFSKMKQSEISAPDPVDFLGFAAYSGLSKYVEYTMDSQLTPWKGRDADYLLICAVGGLGGGLSAYAKFSPQLQLISMLLERGASPSMNMKYSDGNVWSLFLQSLYILSDKIFYHQEAEWRSTTSAFLRSGVNVNEKIHFNLGTASCLLIDIDWSSVAHLASSMPMTLLDFSIRLQLSARVIIEHLLTHHANFLEIRDAFIDAGAVSYIECTKISLKVNHGQKRTRWLDSRLSTQKLDQFVSPYKERIKTAEEPSESFDFSETFDKQIVDLFQELDIETLYEEAGGDGPTKDDDDSSEYFDLSVKDDDESPPPNSTG